MFNAFEEKMLKLLLEQDYDLKEAKNIILKGRYEFYPDFSLAELASKWVERGSIFLPTKNNKDIRYLVSLLVKQGYIETEKGVYKIEKE